MCWRLAVSAENMTLLAVSLFAGVAVLLAGVPMWRSMIGPNRFWGFRTPRTLSDERVWYEANAIAGKGLSLAGALTIALTAASALAPAAFPPLAALSVAGVVLVVVVVWSFVKASAFVGDLDAGRIEAAQGQRHLPREEPDRDPSPASRDRSRTEDRAP